MSFKYIAIGFLIATVYYILKSSMKKTEQKHMTHDSHDDEDVEVLAQSGRKEAAAKAYSKLHDVGLKEANEVVEAMIDKRFHATNHVDDEMNLSPDDEILRTAKSGHKIEAIKIYRQVYGVGLKEAKDEVETMLRNEN